MYCVVSTALLGMDEFEKERIQGRLSKDCLLGIRWQDSSYTFFASLIDPLFDINRKFDDELRSTPLTCALYWRRFDLAEKLLNDKKCDVTIADNDGKTALHYAMRYAYKKIVKKLLQRGADVNHRDNNGETPIFDAFTGSNDLARDTACFSLLLDNKADIAVRNKWGRTFLRDLLPRIYFYNNKEIDKLIEYLIPKAKSTLNSLDNENKTVLDYFCELDEEHLTKSAQKVIWLLLNNGAAYTEKQLQEELIVANFDVLKKLHSHAQAGNDCYALSQLYRVISISENNNN